MNNFTFIIPFRLDTPDRLENLEVILKYYLRHFPDCIYIILEDDYCRAVPSSIINLSPNIKYYQLDNNTTVHQKCATINKGVRYSTTDVVVVLDTDGIANKESIERCVDAVQGEYDFARPCNGFYFKLKKHTKPTFIQKGYDFDYLLGLIDKTQLKYRTNTDDYLILDTPNTLHSTGCIAIFNKQRLIEFGGYNEHFIGWGGEDDELFSRIKKLGGKLYRDDKHEDAVLFHIPHSQPQKHNNPYYSVNVKELNYVIKMPVRELREYIKEKGFYE